MLEDQLTGSNQALQTLQFDKEQQQAELEIQIETLQSSNTVSDAVLAVDQNDLDVFWFSDGAFMAFSVDSSFLYPLVLLMGCLLQALAARLAELERKHQALLALPDHGNDSVLDRSSGQPAERTPLSLLASR
jgi:hypothetical protein